MFFGAKSTVIASNSKQIPSMFLGIFLAHPSKKRPNIHQCFYHKSTYFRRGNPQKKIPLLVWKSSTRGLSECFRLELRSRFRTLLPCGMMEARLGAKWIQRLTENDVPPRREKSERITSLLVCQKKTKRCLGML